MSEKREIAYHFTGDKLRDGRDVPAIGEWLEHKGPAVLCQSGLHASRTPFQAFSFAPGFQLHKVEIAGIVAEIDDKLVSTKRKIIASLDAKEIILSFARKQALSVIHLYDCPQVLREWLETGDPAKQKDASATSAAASAAARAASAAYAATATANAATSAASAAYTAYAAYAYASAAASAAAYAYASAANAASAAYAATATAYAAYAYASAAASAAAYASAAYAASRQKAVEDFNKMVEDAFSAQED